MAEIAFKTRLTEADWAAALRGWRCSALAIPGAVVEALYVEGERVDKTKLETLSQHRMIRWIVGDRPPRAILSIALTEELTLERETPRWSLRLSCQWQRP